MLAADAIRRAYVQTSAVTNRFKPSLSSLEGSYLVAGGYSDYWDAMKRCRRTLLASATANATEVDHCFAGSAQTLEFYTYKSNILNGLNVFDKISVESEIRILKGEGDTGKFYYAEGREYRNATIPLCEEKFAEIKTAFERL